MAKVRKVRLVLLVPPPLLERFTTLAERFGFSRNEVCGRALETGYPATVAWCRRTATAHLGEVLESRFPSQPVPRTVIPVPQPRGESAVDAVRALEADLMEYSKLLLSRSPKLATDTFVAMVSAQAAVLGFPPPDIEPLVDRIVAALYSRPGPGDSGDPDASPSSAAPAAAADELPELDPNAPDIHLD